MPTMQDKKQTAISSLVVFVVLLVLAGFYIYNDINKKGGASSNPSTTNTTANNEPAYTIDQVPIEKGKTVTTKVPDLNRQVIFKADVPSETKKVIIDNIARLVANLKGDNTRFNDWLDLGIQYKIAGDYEGARDAWEYASALSPLNYISFSNLGDLYTNYLKNYSKAEENLKTSIKNKPDYTTGYRALYELYRYSYKEKANLAPQILKEGLSKNPKNTDLMILLAQYYKETGDKTQALKYYNQALNEFGKIGNTSMAALIQKEINNL
jgi:tetratricopeptide (TPR) repeat protein